MQDVRTCPNCGSNQLEIVDSSVSNKSYRRRLSCLDCLNRFTTYEIAVEDFKMFMKIDELIKGYGR